MSIAPYAHQGRTYYRVHVSRGADKPLCITFDSNGERIRTKARAVQLHDEAKVAWRRGSVIDPDTTPLGEFLAHWLEQTAHTRAVSTQRNWESLLANAIVPDLGDVPLGRLTPWDLEGFYRGLVGRYAHSSLATIREVLTGGLKAAVRWQLLPSNPHDGVRLPRSATATTRQVWDANESSRFLLRTEDTRWGCLWRLLLDSGMRIGEALALSWDHLDLAAGTVRIERTVTRTDGTPVWQIRDTPKTQAARRTVSLNDLTIGALRRQWVEQQQRRSGRPSPSADPRGSYQPPEYHGPTPAGVPPHPAVEATGRPSLAWGANLIFDRPLGDGGLSSAACVNNALHRACAAAGVPDLSCHGLRHTCATLLLANGVSLVTVSKRLGHRSIQITADLYAHADRDADKRASEVWVRILNESE